MCPGTAERGPGRPTMVPHCAAALLWRLCLEPSWTSFTVEEKKKKRVGPLRSPAPPGAPVLPASPRLLGATGCRRAGNLRARGLRAQGGLGEWTPPRAGGPWSRTAPGVRGVGWSGEPADWSRAFRLSRRVSPPPPRGENPNAGVRGEGSQSPRNPVAATFADPWDQPGAQFDIRKQRHRTERFWFPGSPS